MAYFHTHGTGGMASAHKRIRILYTIPNFDTAGSGKALLNIATRLDRAQFEPHIMCMHDRGEFFKAVTGSGLPIHVFEYTTPMKPYWRGFIQCWKISREFKKIKPDLIHSFHYSADYSEALAARLGGVKWIYTKKNMNWGGDSRRAWWLRTRLASAVVAQNREMVESFFPGMHKVTLIPRGVDVASFRRASPQKKVAEEPPVLVTVANLAPVKNIEWLITALMHLHREDVRAQLWIVGDSENEYGHRLRRLVRETGLMDAVVFHGKKLDPRSFLHESDVFVLPSQKESSPVALLEAMAAGLPVVATRTAGALEIMGDWPEQLADSPEELSQRIREMLELNAAARAQVVHRQYERLETRHTIADEVRSHENLYCSLA